VGAPGLLGGTHISLRALSAVAPPALRSEHLELPHRIGCRCRGCSRRRARRSCIEPMRSVPESERDPARLEALRQAVLEYSGPGDRSQAKGVRLWGGKPVGPAASKAYGWTEPGTVYQYRARAGWPPSERVFRNADRFLFQLLSRIETDDPIERSPAGAGILVEFQRGRQGDPGLGRWHGAWGGKERPAPGARRPQRRSRSPRHCTHPIASNVSLYLRSELAANPSRRRRGRRCWTLMPPAHDLRRGDAGILAPVQRERAGFIERLGHYFSSPAPRTRVLFILRAKSPESRSSSSSATRCVRTPRAISPTSPSPLYWIELMARLGSCARFERQPGAGRLFNECTTKDLEPEEPARHAQGDEPAHGALLPARGTGKSPAQRQTDATFRWAHSPVDGDSRRDRPSLPLALGS